MPTKKMTAKRAALLAELEYLIGSECYNGSIQNWGPNGTQYSSGREFRYPLTVVDEGGDKTKYRYKADSSDAIQLSSGHYAFGANRLHVVEGLNKVLDYLESNHGLKL
ncbi:hypothetical protein [Maliponia aquimaris]|jgi:hypothetical protein|uniref:Uncharacterized protein n=1 Tax=Maliponia aquimaris TaxID=1673631 RepID=A0A238K6C8_9RHOB|nr:hypothetical protein [Maliponia aquimaris]SMX37506.1 hypothetical protein MAA8898_01167 [Maliponia aquimaris]